MRVWSHEELHEMIDKKRSLKNRSKRLHGLPPPSSFEEVENRKAQMLTIYTEVIGCRQVETAQNALGQVYTYISSKYAFGSGYNLSNEDWVQIQCIMETFASENKCHSPRGNDYVCYCE